MIRSMTAFGSASVEWEHGSLTLELRSVNSRFLDLYFRLPDELRHLEEPLRELLATQLKRGKVDVRLSYTHHASPQLDPLSPQWLHQLADQLALVRQVLPDIDPPRFIELFSWPKNRPDNRAVPTWNNAGQPAAQRALAQLQQTRLREGDRLAVMMRQCAVKIKEILNSVEQDLPLILETYRTKLSTKLRESIEIACPGGFTYISGPELSERLAQEASCFALRIDVAEELSRLNSHLTELDHLLSAPTLPPTTEGIGKRLDFLFQEMNREANTLGSKTGSLSMTRAAMDMKLLIEQLREQAQNIE